MIRTLKNANVFVFNFCLSQIIRHSGYYIHLTACISFSHNNTLNKSLNRHVL